LEGGMYFVNERRAINVSSMITLRILRHLMQLLLDVVFR
jgi:hypothetical protein